MQDGRKAVWSIPYVSVAFFPSLKQNFIVYCSFKVSSRPDCIFEIHQLWQSGVSRVYSNCCCSCWFEPEIIKIGQSSHIAITCWIFRSLQQFLNAYTKKKVWKLIEGTTYITIQFSVSTVSMSKIVQFQIIQFSQAVLIQLIQFSISTDFVYTVICQNSSMLNNSV